MMRLRFFVFCFVFIALFAAAQAQDKASLRTVAEGLYHPLGMVLLPDGGVLIAEMGSREKDTRFGFSLDSAGVSRLNADGSLGRLISGFPSGHDPADLLGALSLSLSPDQSTIHLGHFDSQQLYTLPVEYAASLPDQPFYPDDLGRFMAGTGGAGDAFLLHPYDIAFDAAGMPIVSDALGNSLVSAQGGAWNTVHRFAALDDPKHLSGRLEAVPRGIARAGSEYYVALFGGCPHPANSGELAAVDQNGRQRTVVDNLNMPIDVEIDAAGNIWILEFAIFLAGETCFEEEAYQPHSGRLSRINADGLLETVVEGLDFPGAVLPLPDGSLYISEVFAGRIRHLQFNAPPPSLQRVASANPPEPQYASVPDADAALRQVIVREDLSPYPGRDQLEGDTELARLGRDLFFDPILSGDQNISCATCHHPDFAMADGRVLPIGAGGEGLGESRAFLSHVTVSADTRYDIEGQQPNPLIGEFIPRNSPTVINATLLPAQFWDSKVEFFDAATSTPEDAITEMGLADVMVAQALFPIVSRREMAGVTFGDEPAMVIRNLLVERLRNSAVYAARFEAVFGTRAIEPLHIAQALAAFQRQLIFTAAPWDDYVAGDLGALSAAQKRGALLFFGVLNPDFNCAGCHSGDLFTDLQHYNLLVPQIGTGKRNGTSGREDFGRANVSFDHRDLYTFRTPSLRNVELTAPYFHSGAYPTLSAVVWHHTDIWGANMRYEPRQHLPPAFQSAWLPHNFERQGHSAALQLQAGLPMSEADVADLVDFMSALTDSRARDLRHILPAEVPSGLPLDIAGVQDTNR